MESLIEMHPTKFRSHHLESALHMFIFTSLAIVIALWLMRPLCLGVIKKLLVI